LKKSISYCHFCQSGYPLLILYIYLTNVYLICQLYPSMFYLSHFCLLHSGFQNEVVTVIFILPQLDHTASTCCVRHVNYAFSFRFLQWCTLLSMRTTVIAAGCVSICPSVCPSPSDVLSRRMKI